MFVVLISVAVASWFGTQAILNAINAPRIADLVQEGEENPRLLQMLLDQAQVVLQVLDFESGQRLVHGICAEVMRAEMVIIRPLI